MFMLKMFGICVVLFAMAVYGFSQEMTPAPPDPTTNWSKLGPTVEGTRGFTLHGKGIRLNPDGNYELWIKIIPANRPAFTKRYDLPSATAFVLQYATVNCKKRLLLFERTAAYGNDNRTLEGRMSGITPASKKDMVKPGSIGEALYRFVCVETTTLPLTSN